MVSDIVKDFVGSLFVERAKEPGHEGAFDKGVADYFRAGSGLTPPQAGRIICTVP